MHKKIIDLIGGDATLYYEGGNLETVPIIPPSDSLKIGEAVKDSNTLSSCSHTRENPLIQKELHFY